MSRSVVARGSGQVGWGAVRWPWPDATQVFCRDIVSVAVWSCFARCHWGKLAKECLLLTRESVATQK